MVRSTQRKLSLIASGEVSETLEREVELGAEVEKLRAELAEARLADDEVYVLRSTLKTERERAEKAEAELAEVEKLRERNRALWGNWQLATEQRDKAEAKLAEGADAWGDQLQRAEKAEARLAELEKERDGLQHQLDLERVT